jgi:crotonobetainyl-CoA:carnitine CoA-transferase CaiB-like acyl-CoA transferase
MSLPLADIKVLDAGGPLSAYAGKLLADLGARVVHVDESHRADDAPSLVFAYYHSGQQSVRLDVTDPAATDELADLAAECDVVLLTPTAARPVAGLDVAELTLDWAPGSAVVLCLTPFGLSGPLTGWRMTPLTSYAMSGLMYKMGRPDGPPVTVPGPQAWDQAATQGVIAILAALSARETYGGQLIDLAVHDYLTAQDDLIQRYSVAGVRLTRGEAAGYPPTGVWECRDGTIEFQVHTERHWAGFLDMLGRPASLSAPELSGRLARLREAERLIPLIRKMLAPLSRLELVEQGQARGVPCGLLNTPEQYLTDPQIEARGLVVERDHPHLGRIRVPGTPFRSSSPLTRAALEPSHE